MNNDGIWSLIPQIYYDLIARIIPGIILITIFIIFLGCPCLSKTIDYKIIIGFVLILSYGMGFVLEIACNIIWDEFICNEKSFKSDKKLWRWIRNSDKSILLTKMMAEKAMFRSMVLISIIAFFLILINPWIIPYCLTCVLLLSLLLPIIFAVCMFRVYRWILEALGID